jgi:lipoate-protein ligase B
MVLVNWWGIPSSTWGMHRYASPLSHTTIEIVLTRSVQLSTRCYVDRLEKFLAHLTTELGVDVYPLPHTGVFTSTTAKIGSIGIHVRRRITLHGFSLNIEDQVLDWFNHIVACGLDEVKATSVQTVIREEETSKKKGGMKVGSVVDLAVRGFGEAYGRRMEKLGSAGEHEELIETIRAGTRGELPLLGPLAV